MRKSEYTDQYILAVRSKYLEKLSESLPAGKEILIGGRRVPLRREMLFDGRCSIMLPESMADMDHQRAITVYRRPDRPQIIKMDHNTGSTLTFSLLSLDGMGEGEEIAKLLTKVRHDMKKIWQQYVFYDRGEVMAEGTLVAWMDLKAFCLDGSLYSMIFMFRMEGQTVLGNFHCSFSQYDTWKPIVLKMLATIQIKDLTDCDREAMRGADIINVKD